MKLLIALFVTLILSGCANMHRQEWKPGQKIGFVWVTNHDGCQDKLVIGQKTFYSKCF